MADETTPGPNTSPTEAATAAPSEEPPTGASDGMSGDASPPWERDRIGPAPVGGGPKLVVLALAVALVAGAWWWSGREEPPGVGDRFAVVAEVRSECMSLRITHDDLAMSALSHIPQRWKGTTVPGTLEITERLPDDDVPGRDLVGTFVADDGTEVRVWGGTGTQFTPLGCGVWVP